MAFINCSVFNLADGKFFQTKKELREAVKADPSKVLLTSTSEFGPGGIRQITADMVVPGDTWVVVGPTPRDRRWYANVIAKGNPSAPVVS